MKAAALQDRKGARKIFIGPYGLKIYFAENLSDLGFDNEEFSHTLWDSNVETVI
jgi:hypothetical protein